MTVIKKLALVSHDEAECQRGLPSSVVTSGWGSAIFEGKRKETSIRIMGNGCTEY